MFKGNILSLVLLGLIGVSCGKGSSDNDDGPKLGPITYAENPIFISKQDNNCDGQIFAADADIEFQIDQLIGQFTLANYLDFKGQVVENIIKSQVKMPITITKYGQYSEELRTIEYNKELGAYDPRTLRRESAEKDIEAKKDLNVCPGTTTYETNTYESAGLNISYSITKTYEKLMEVDPALRLKPISVNVVPYKKIITRTIGGKSKNKRFGVYETDNAYYHPIDLEIVFLPQSESLRDSTKGNPFWEIPMVASHEYGHHVFGTLVFGKNKPELAKSALGGCFETHQSHEYNEFKPGAAKAEIREDNNEMFAIRAMNEGFSDLISFYSLNDDERSLEAVECFKKNRQVDSKTFGDGTAKKFTYSALSSINSSLTDAKDQDCDTPDFQQIHQVGAIFAHVSNELLNSIGLDKDQKLKAILGYAKELGSMDDFGGTTPGNVLFYSVEIMVKNGLAQKGITANSEHCKMMSDHFNQLNSPSCKYLVTE